MNSKRIRRSSVADSLYKNLNALQYIFRLMDTDGSGTVGTEEFVSAIMLMSKHLHGTQMTEDDAREMANAIDMDHNGEIDFNEFAESFRLIENQMDEDTAMKTIEEAERRKSDASMTSPVGDSEEAEEEVEEDEKEEEKDSEEKEEEVVVEETDEKSAE